MDKTQKINCTVKSCKHQNTEKNVCELGKIKIAPKENTDSHLPDESMCSNYNFEN